MNYNGYEGTGHGSPLPVKLFTLTEMLMNGYLRRDYSRTLFPPDTILCVLWSVPEDAVIRVDGCTIFAIEASERGIFAFAEDHWIRVPLDSAVYDVILPPVFPYTAY